MKYFFICLFFMLAFIFGELFLVSTKNTSKSSHIEQSSSTLNNAVLEANAYDGGIAGDVMAVQKLTENNR